MNFITRKTLLWIGVFCLFLPSLLQAYLLMPFPFSQDFEAISLAFFLQKIIFPLRIIGLLSVSYPTFYYFTKGTNKQKIIVSIIILLAGITYYFTDISYKAEVMFEEPKSIKFLTKEENKLPDSLIVLSVLNNGIAKAFPINFVGYHHKIQDEIGNLPALVTYCTMCRTGVVFSPIVNGKKQTFRLVGARHYNAVLEDAETKSWWYQATGQAVVGKLKGQQLVVIPSEQMTLKTFLQQYPKGLILQANENYKKEYTDLKNYDRRQRKDEDSLKNPNKFWDKSWVIGITINQKNKAYSWAKLLNISILQDDFAKVPLLLVIENDKHNFHVFDRKIDNKILDFELDSAQNKLRDKTSKSLWNWQGECVEGELKGQKLRKIPAQQEYWRAWKEFHQPTEIWH